MYPVIRRQPSRSVAGWVRMGRVQPFPQPDLAPEAVPQVRLRRPRSRRVVGGVCAGLAEHLNLPLPLVRAGFVVTAAMSGAGVIAYLFLWALTPQDLTGASPPSRPIGTRGQRNGGDPEVTAETVRNVGVGAVLVVAGAGLMARRYGVNLQLGLLLPLLAIGLGAVLAWSQLDDTQRGLWLTSSGSIRRPGVLRLLLGMVLASGGLIALATQGRGVAALWSVAIAAVAVLGGVGLIAAPWAVRLWNDLRDEQAQRVRETERADIAAHLHDSVLQTLALIQRKAGDPTEVARLARAQERELRGWLYAAPPGAQSTLGSAVTASAHEVEDLQGVPIELVVTGDRPLDEPGAALARALREALLNASRHGAPPVSAYVEIGSGDAGVEAFVRDHGAGFDQGAIPADRLGVRESIVGRMQRHGGTARLRRLEDGTEVAMTLPGVASTRDEHAGSGGSGGAGEGGSPAGSGAIHAPADSAAAERQPQR